MNTTPTSFSGYIQQLSEKGLMASDDLVAFMLPLFREIVSLHEDELVGPFDQPETLFMTGNSLDIDENRAHARRNQLSAIEKLSKTSRSFEITGTVQVQDNLDTGMRQLKDGQLQTDLQQPITQPVYLPGYRCYEILLGHHDEQTDIFCLGLYLGSAALGLDLHDPEEMEEFLRYRSNVTARNPRLHPALSALIREMTELDRGKRTQDMYEALHQLEHYRNYDPEKQTDLSQVSGWLNKELGNRSQFILNKLRNRLFDTSRRNRLLYFKPNARFVNLTVASVPMVLHVESIRPEFLFTWNGEVAGRISQGKEIPLNKYLRFEDHRYLSGALNNVRVDAQRDMQEYGFSQLKLVACFLHWHNLKESPNERIMSPLLLIPAALKKTKHIREDQFTLEFTDNIAEVNPVLANLLREQHGIRLPDFVDLSEMSITTFYELLRSQIEGAAQGITLRLVDKPRIRFIQSIARQTISRHKKRLRQNISMRSYREMEYSYDREHFKPLGLEIFLNRVKPRPSYLEFLVNTDIKPASMRLTGDTVNSERELYTLEEGENNPYLWEFDCCNMVLGNFNYRKMGLVRDYNTVADQNLQHTVFEQLFSAEPRPTQETQPPAPHPEESYHVVAADPTQARAIGMGRKEVSYIIQGPPGTGKSQTITNLIADFVARDKNILFVCEKRAALDVVYHRLKQQGLDELCCYVHDSLTDKREFIRNLKSTYENFTAQRMDIDAIRKTRSELAGEMLRRMRTLQEFHQTHIQRTEHSGIPIRQLMDRIAELAALIQPLEKGREEILPDYARWIQAGDAIRQLAQALEAATGTDVFAETVFSRLNPALFSSEHPYNRASALVNDARKHFDQISSGLSQYQVPAAFKEQWNSLQELMQDALLLKPLADYNTLDLLQPGSEASRQFEAALAQYRQYKESVHNLSAKNKSWRKKFSEQDARNALEIARKHERSFFRFLNKNWRALKRTMQAEYDFSQHAVHPVFSAVLQLLLDEYEANARLEQEKNTARQKYKTDDLEQFAGQVHTLTGKQNDPELRYLMQQPAPTITALCQLKDKSDSLRQCLDQLLAHYPLSGWDELGDDLENIALNIDHLPELVPALREYTRWPEALQQAVRQLPLSPDNLEAAIASKTLQNLYRENKTFAAADMALIEKEVHELSRCYKQLLAINGQYIRAQVRDRFLRHLDQSNMAISQLDATQKKFKKEYTEGRKILENEFGKSMRYKSIRELAEKESGLVLKDLKPVWLMSPLSVSDSLPLATHYFDVVIFDEASQITLEEGIPSLFRAPQTIIVGDDKQMPPTNFFNASRNEDDASIAETELEEEWFTNDTDSLLVQGVRKLESVMLQWHYRSRYEDLISFSNHAFYQAGLLTIPDKVAGHMEKPALRVQQPAEAAANSAALFDRSISYHYLPDGVYEHRTNPDEARYIAHLVKELLVSGRKESIGIVAFSQEQQLTIEDALSQLAAEDKQFEQLLEEAYERVEDDQYIGLFVKNLENVQGDERDIILMSVCYGFDSRKKMIMNFGPINKKGGEKRLNVIFSRAKKHMAIVSSIRHDHITNEYNEGANYFRRFLHFAELTSTGQTKTARTILDGLVHHPSPGKSTGIPLTAVLQQIREQLEKQGLVVETHIGQSRFKCSLGIKLKPGDSVYQLGVLLDDETHYENPDVLEQYYQRPEILQAFGWKTISVFAKDWIAQPGKVMEKINQRLLQQYAPQDEDDTLAEFKARLQNFSQPIAKGIKTETAGSPYDHLVFDRLECTEEGASKFWEVAVDQHKMIIRFGRIGSRGQTQIKTFASAEAAEQEKEKQMRIKIANGYAQQ